jgi:hypothetical protein
LFALIGECPITSNAEPTSHLQMTRVISALPQKTPVQELARFAKASGTPRAD